MEKCGALVSRYLYVFCFFCWPWLGILSAYCLHSLTNKKLFSFLKWACSLTALRPTCWCLLGAPVSSLRAVRLWCAGMYSSPGLANTRKQLSSSEITAGEAVAQLCLALQWLRGFMSPFTGKSNFPVPFLFCSFLWVLPLSWLAEMAVM